jgi:hypothetical protein
MRTGLRLHRLVFAAGLFALPFLVPARPCAQWTCRAPSAPSVSSGTIDAADPLQSGRLLGVGVPSDCARRGGTQTGTLLRHYESSIGVVGGSQHSCVNVTVDATACGGNPILAAAYLEPFDPNDLEANLLGDAGNTIFTTASFRYPVNSGQSTRLIVSEFTANAGCPSYTVSVSVQTCRPPGFERSGDRTADVTVFRPSNGVWHTLDAAGAPFASTQFGASTDLLTAADYTGAGPSNLSVWRPGAQAAWFYRLSNGSLFAEPFGTTGDVPVPSNFDGDHKTDLTVFRPDTGVWWTKLSSTANVVGLPFGQVGDLPFAGDVDGDLITDHGIVRPVAGTLQWWIRRSKTSDVVGTTFGLSNDKPVAADYDGDRRTDIAVWRPADGTWYYIRSTDNVFTGFAFGVNGDIPQPADRDGDGKADFVVFRQSVTPGETTWYSWLSATSTLKAEPWGQIADLPALSQNRIQ